jgi:hypothetical protein
VRIPTRKTSRGADAWSEDASTRRASDRARLAGMDRLVPIGQLHFVDGASPTESRSTVDGPARADRYGRAQQIAHMGVCGTQNRAQPDIAGRSSVVHTAGRPRIGGAELTDGLHARRRRGRHVALAPGRSTAGAESPHSLSRRSVLITRARRRVRSRWASTTRVGVSSFDSGRPG